MHCCYGDHVSKETAPDGAFSEGVNGSVYEHEV